MNTTTIIIICVVIAVIILVIVGMIMFTGSKTTTETSSETDSTNTDNNDSNSDNSSDIESVNVDSDVLQEYDVSDYRPLKILPVMYLRKPRHNRTVWSKGDWKELLLKGSSDTNNLATWNPDNQFNSQGEGDVTEQFKSYAEAFLSYFNISLNEYAQVNVYSNGNMPYDRKYKIIQYEESKYRGEFYDMSMDWTIDNKRLSADIIEELKIKGKDDGADSTDISSVNDTIDNNETNFIIQRSGIYIRDTRADWKNYMFTSANEIQYNNDNLREFSNWEDFNNKAVEDSDVLNQIKTYVESHLIFYGYRDYELAESKVFTKTDLGNLKIKFFKVSDSEAGTTTYTCEIYVDNGMKKSINWSVNALTDGEMNDLAKNKHYGFREKPELIGNECKRFSTKDQQGIVADDWYSSSNPFFGGGGSCYQNCSTNTNQRHGDGFCKCSYENVATDCLTNQICINERCMTKLSN